MAEIKVFYEGPIVTRAEAKTRVLRRYFTGKPCRRGHLSERWASNAMCVVCLRNRSWREPAPLRAEPIVIYDGPLLSRSNAKAAEISKYITGKPCINGHIAQRWTGNAECTECVLSPKRQEQRRQAGARYGRSAKGLAAAKKHRQSAKGRATQLAHVKRFRKTEKGKKVHANVENRRRARKRSAGPGSFTPGDIEKLMTQQKHCYICGKRFTKIDPATFDHVVPLAENGTHDRSNIALAHRSCNFRKGPRRTHLI